MIRQFGRLVGLTLAVTSVFGASAGERKLRLDQVPPVVRATLEHQAGNGKIIDVDISGDPGREVYTSEIHRNGKEIDAQVAPDGKLLSTEVVDASPAPTRGRGLTTDLVTGNFRYWLLGAGALIVALGIWLKRKKEANSSS